MGAALSSRRAARGGDCKRIELSRAPFPQKRTPAASRARRRAREREAVPEYGAENRAASDCRCPPVATPATTMLCASIILPMTPPVLFAAAISIGERPSCCAVTCCRLPKSTFEAVSLPVSATPSQPSSGEKNGKAPAGACEGQSQRRVRAAVARGETQRQHQRDRQERDAHAPERARVELRSSATGPRPRASRRATPRAGARCRWPKEALSVKIAFSARSSGATGGTFITAWCSSGTGNCRRYMPLSQFLAPGSAPEETRTPSESSTAATPHAGRGRGRCRGCSGAAGAASLEAPHPPGCQNLISSTSAPIETSALAISTSHGPWKLLVRNCTKAKLSRRRGTRARPRSSRASRPARRRARTAR